MFKGSIVAIITPFNEDLSVNFDKLQELLEWHVQEGTDGIVILGTTGEASTLSKQEKLDVFKFTVDVINKRIPVIAGTGSNNTLETLSFSREVEKLKVDGLLIVTPYYNKATDRGYIMHYETIANNVSTPIILYNVPSRTGDCLSVDVVTHLSNHKNIVGIKEASGNLSYVAQIKAATTDFLVFSGNDDTVLPVLSLGGDGVISVAANVIPKAFSDMVRLYKENKTTEATSMQLQYIELINNLFIEQNPIPAKEFLNQMNKNVGSYRLPLCDPTEETVAIIKETVQNYNL